MAATMSTPTFSTGATIVGMSCGHCVASVREEVTAIPGVQHVDVDLSTGVVRVLADRPIDGTELSAAIVEAGFDVVTAGSGG